MNMSIELQRIADKPAMVVAHHGPIHRIRKMFETRDVGMFYSTIAAGAELPREVHRFIEIIYRIKGETVTVIDGKEYVTGPGGFLVVPAGCWHQTTPRTPDQAIEQVIVATYNQISGSLFPLIESLLGAVPPPHQGATAALSLAAGD
jgi:quercetin dioxygenase-like cupin family protein